MKELASITIQKNFGHCFIRWKVRNFGLATCHERFIVRSPKFKIQGPGLTDWQMQLETPSADDDRVLFHLERLSKGPDVVWVNWRLILKDGKLDLRNGISDYESENFFKRKQKYTMDIESVNLDLATMSGDVLDMLVISCRMLVKYESVAQISPYKTIDAGLLSLSEDFRRMFSRGKYYDVVMRIDDKVIRGHKSILCRRCTVLPKLISNFEHCKIINLPNFSPEATESVIAYLYTGNLRYILRNPSIALYDCVEFFEVEQLKPLFYPEDVSIATKLASQVTTFRWLVPNFSNRRKKYVHSGILERTNMNATWRLHVYPYGSDRCSEIMAIYAEVVTSVEFRNAYLEFALLDSFNEIINKVRVKGQLVAGEWIGVENFLHRSHLEDVLRKGDLRVLLKIWISKTDQYSTLFSRNYEGDTNIFTYPHYISLSKDINGMLNHPSYADIILRAKGIEAEAHKCILAARSKTFSKILDKLDRELNTDLEGDILTMFLRYIYSGILGNDEVSYLLKLYKAAEEYCISTLKQDCCKSLLSKLSTQNAIEILVFAEDNKEQELKSASLRFIRMYKNDIVTDSNWKHLLEGRTTLMKEIHEYFPLPPV